MLTQKNVWMFLAVVLAGLLLYSNVLDGEFLVDDYVFIVDNPAIRDIARWDKIWEFFNTRTIVGLTFALNYSLHQLSVEGYHLVNIILHVFAAIMVFGLVRLTFRTPALARSTLQPRAEWISFFSAMVFLCHPLQTEAVAYIAQRASILSVVFYVGTMIAYIQSRLTGRRAYALMALLSMLAGLFTKENIVTLPFSLLVYEMYFLGGPGADLKKRAWGLSPFWALLFLFPLVTSQVRIHSATQVTFGVGLEHFDWRYFLTEVNVLRTYLRLMVFPAGQRFDYDYPIASGGWEGPTLWSFVLLGALGTGAAILFKKHRILSYSISWFFVTTAVELVAVTFGARYVIYEHWAYLAMVGFSFFAAALAGVLLKREAFYQKAMVLAVLLMGALTYQRNGVWRRETTFWDEAVKRSPRKISVYLGAGKAFQRKGIDDQAMKFYDQAVALSPEGSDENDHFENDALARIHNNRGVLLARNGRMAEAIASFQASVRIFPGGMEALRNLGIAYEETVQLAQAVSAWKQLTGSRKYAADAFYHLGLCYLAQGKKELAREALKTARSIYSQAGHQSAVEEIDELINRQR